MLQTNGLSPVGISEWRAIPDGFWTTFGMPQVFFQFKERERERRMKCMKREKHAYGAMLFSRTRLGDWDRMERLLWKMVEGEKKLEIRGEGKMTLALVCTESRRACDSPLFCVPCLVSRIPVIPDPRPHLLLGYS